MFTLPEPMAAFLHQQASSLLRHVGINEPVTWEPPFSWVIGITWPGPHPADINPITERHPDASQDCSLSRGTSPSRAVQLPSTLQHGVFKFGSSLQPGFWPTSFGT